MQDILGERALLPGWLSPRQKPAPFGCLMLFPHPARVNAQPLPHCPLPLPANLPNSYILKAFPRIQYSLVAARDTKKPLPDWGGTSNTYDSGEIVLRSLSRGVVLSSLLLALAGSSSFLFAQDLKPNLKAQSDFLFDENSPAPLDPPASLSDSLSTQDPSQPKTPSDPPPSGDGSASKIDSPKPKTNPDDDPAQQTKRILWIVPNFRSVSANTYLPPLSFKEKLWLATQDSFDYSTFIYVGLIAGGAMWQKSEPSFGQGASGYANYYSHTLADNTIENYMVEAFVPALTKEDPRYYTLGTGGFFKRTGYAVSRLFITRTDSGNKTVNISEVVGAGAAAGIGNAYYPDDTNPWVKTYQRWISQIIQDGAGNIVKEFWPDINRAIFHNKY